MICAVQMWRWLGKQHLLTAASSSSSSSNSSSNTNIGGAFRLVVVTYGSKYM